MLVHENGTHFYVVNDSSSVPWLSIEFNTEVSFHITCFVDVIKYPYSKSDADIDL